MYEGIGQGGLGKVNVREDRGWTDDRKTGGIQDRMDLEQERPEQDEYLTSLRRDKMLVNMIAGESRKVTFVFCKHREHQP